MNRYDIFLKVIETGSFTKTAQELNYTQGAISQMVHTLEEELATTLIIRSKIGITLTKDGTEYLPYIQSVSSAQHELSVKKQEMNGLKNAVIKIGTFTSISRNLLPIWIKGFKKQYPTVQFILQQGEYTNISEWIKDGSVDFGFVNPAAVSDINIIPIKQDEMMAVLPVNHPLADLKTVPLSKLAKEPFILLDEGKFSVPLTAFKDNNLTPNIEYKVFDDYTIMAMVEQELGVSILYKLVLNNCPHNIIFKTITPSIGRTIALSYRNKNTIPIASRCFIDYILQQVE